MDKENLIKKITQKKEFSNLPKKDVEMVFEKFDKKNYLEEEKIKLTRDLLRKIYSGFTSGKLLNLKDKELEWFLRKHLSTRERLNFYKEVYENFLAGFEKRVSVIDLGCGVNGFSYSFFPLKVDYVGVEAIGQLVDLQNHYFKNQNLSGKVLHLSLFDLKKVKNLVLKTRKPRIIFLFKTLDSLEMLERDYSKKLLLEITPLAERVVVSFATKSMKKRTSFKINRNWIVNFIKENFNLLEDFNLGDERYIVFEKTKTL